MITIRTAEDAERAGLVRIWRSAVEATHHFLTPADIDWYEPHVLSYLTSAVDLRVAVPNGTADGALGFIVQEAGAIQMLFVAEEAQGAGVGSALLASVHADVLETEASELTVDVNEDNQSGRRFYAARGFTVASRSDLDDQGRPFPILHLRLTLTRDGVSATRRRN